MTKMLAFDPSDRLDVYQALEHPWLSAYHDESDEPVCAAKFERWREIEKLETIEDFRTALWNEIEDYRREVRGIHLLPPLKREQVTEPAATEVNGKSSLDVNGKAESQEPSETDPTTTSEGTEDVPEPATSPPPPSTSTTEPPSETEPNEVIKVDLSHSIIVQPGATATEPERIYTTSPEQPYRDDPVVKYARRSSILQPSRQGSTFNSPIPSHQHLPTFIEDSDTIVSPKGPGGPTPTSTATLSNLGPGTITFPSSVGQSYVVPARSRTGSTAGGGEVTRRLLRTLSTVSIHESSQGVRGLGEIAPIGKFIVPHGAQTEADAPPSEVPMDFNVEEDEEGEGEGVFRRKGKERALFHV